MNNNPVLSADGSIKRSVFKFDMPSLLIFILAAGLAFIIAFPVLWLLFGAFKEPFRVFTYPPQLLPNPFTLENISALFRMSTPFHVYFWNSTMVSVLHVIGACVLSSMMGYALAKYNFPFKKLIFGLILTGMLVPLQVIIIPLFLTVRNTGLTNTRAALIIPFIAHPLGAFLFRQYMMSVPDSIIDSGRIDGASELRIYWQAFVPMVGPAFAAFAVVDFVESWNGFAWPLVVLNSQSKFTLPVWLNALVQDQYSYNFGVLFAAALFTILPAVLAFIIFQKWFVNGFVLHSEK
jgi:multiple sugar transport system permease protein